MIRQRALYPQILEHLSKKQHTIITGARQVGKTSLLQLLYKELQQGGKTVRYLSFEDPIILEAVNEHPEKVLSFLPVLPLPSLEGQQEQPVYLLIDEVQYAKDPTHLLKYLYDKFQQNLKIVATGSSAFYIDQTFTDSLAGRKRIFRLYPLSFQEYLDFSNVPDLQQEVSLLRSREGYISPQAQTLTAHFYQFLTYGGYPEVVLASDPGEKRIILEELKNSYIKRDLLESGVGMETKFFLLIQLLSDQIGNLVNKKELSNTLQIDSKTVDQYLYVLQKCFHIQLLKPFFRNLRKELTKMPKVYFNDLGLRNIFLNRFDPVFSRSDKGQLLENYYFLVFQQTYSIDQIRFWRTSEKHEVDFVVESSFGQGNAYEIKWDRKSFQPGKYKQFQDAYPQFPLSCLDASTIFRQ